MSLYYDGANKAWNRVDEPTNYQTEYPFDYNFEKETQRQLKYDQDRPQPTWNMEPDENGDYSWTDSDNGNQYYWSPYEDVTNEDAVNKNREKRTRNEKYQKLQKEAIDLNAKNQALNNFDTAVLQIIQATKGGSYNYLDAKQAILNKKGILTNSGISEDEANNIINKQLNSTYGDFKSFYIAERITPWDPSVLPANLNTTVRQRSDIGNDFNRYVDGSQGYYLTQTEQGKKASAEWDAAVSADNLDIIARYGSKEAYAKQDYLNQITDPTKTSEQIRAIRGSQSAPLSTLVTEYREQVFPDAIAQQTRDQVQKKIFGLQPVKTPGATGYEFRDVTTELSDFITADKTTNNLWQQAKNEARLTGVFKAVPGVWQNLSNSLKVDQTFLTNQENFGILLGRTANLNENDPEDKKIIESNKQLVDTIKGLKNNATFKDIISYIPEINDAFTNSVQASESYQTKKFGQLRQNILQDTINELVQAKRKEASISLLKSSSVGKELSGLQDVITNSILGDIGIGGALPGLPSQEGLKNKLNLGLDSVFGTKNGLIYSWEDWFNNQIEKKYAGGIDIPNDYITSKFRTASNGFVDQATINTWKKYDQAYIDLKIDPNNLFAKAVVDNRPSDYVAVENRKSIQPSWLEYEAKLKKAGYIEPQTLSSWSIYDKAYSDLQKNPNDRNAQNIYARKPADYIAPQDRMDKDVQFAKDFFSKYLKPRFDASQSIAEFQDYIDITKNTQTPFQTQDRLNALKLAAQTSVSNWFAHLQQAGDSKFNSEYYFDPIGYLKTNGVGDPNDPLLPGAAFIDYADTTAGEKATIQKAQVESDWAAAKNNEITTDSKGNSISWAGQAYRYGIDVNDKASFAKLHYQIYGMNAPTPFDPAPDIYAPQVAKTYITQILTPYLIDTANKIGSVFGEFVKPADYVNEVLKAVNLPENKSKWDQILNTYGLNPKASLDEIKNTLTDILSQDSTQTIKKKIGDLITAGKTLTQTELGVEFIQKATTPSGTIAPASGVYALFKNAGFSGTENEFYSQFMPEASAQDISIINASYTPGGQKTPLLPTISGTGLEQISSIADLFGDTDVQAVLATAGVTPSENKKPSLFAQLITTSGEDIGIGDPFAQTKKTVSGTTTSDVTDNMGINNPFDDVGIGDPFAEATNPFSDSSNPFETMGAKTSATTPKIGSIGNLFGSALSTSKSTKGFTSSLFDDFGSL